MNELRAELDGNGRGQGSVGQDATADALAGFEDDDVMARGRELGRRREASRARTDDDCVGIL